MSRLACFVPPDLLHEIARTTKSAKLRRSALDSLAIDAAIRTQRAENAARTLTVPMSAHAGQRHAATVHPRPAEQRGHDAGPGRAGRRAGRGRRRRGDEAYDGFGDTYLFWEVLTATRSTTGPAAPCHRPLRHRVQQRLLERRADGVRRRRRRDLPGSPIAGRHRPRTRPRRHRDTANLVYIQQSGALNESISDVFGSLVKQYALSRPPSRPTG